MLGASLGKKVGSLQTEAEVTRTQMHDSTKLGEHPDCNLETTFYNDTNFAEKLHLFEKIMA